ncbi:hypothetical protein HIM_09574 [Hirsutella minnesotensis 3608]|uniref:N-acetyltransferase domain-containing protein n=1 Tax=Hirsutella minnesotensis 3608 TaxID=1043627 RepID=A0A0F7ZXN8_9HYPO|nr:hypothetical protein HIM_09574 [Hirsutella minnesotensis 3608]
MQHANSFVVRQATSAADVEAARDCFIAYTTWLDEDISFQNYKTELQGLPGQYVPPLGALLLAVDPSVDHQILGCVAVRGIRVEPEYRGNRPEMTRVCEMKRLFVYPEARGRQVGRALIRAAVERARAAGYDQMVFDTMERMKAAIRLYESEGFREDGPYYFNPLTEDPMKGVLFFSKELQI